MIWEPEGQVEMSRYRCRSSVKVCPCVSEGVGVTLSTIREIIARGRAVCIRMYGYVCACMCVCVDM